MLDLNALDLDEIATALADQTDYEHRWLIDSLPSSVWYEDMADFAQGISDEAAYRALTRAIQGNGTFRAPGGPVAGRQLTGR